MAFNHLKTMSSKVDARVRTELHNIKRKVPRTKIGDANNAVNDHTAPGINEAAKNHEATAADKADAVNTTIAVFAIIHSNNVTSAKSQRHVNSSGSEKGASHATLTQSKMEGLPQRGKAKREYTRRILKRRAPIVDSLDDGCPRKKVRHNEQGPWPPIEHNQANKEVDYAGVHVMSLSSHKSDKKSKRAARREARKAKWAMRRTAFKTKAKKVLDSAVTPGMIALVIIFSPVIVALSILGFVLDSVVMLIIHILDCLWAPVTLCIRWPFN